MGGVELLALAASTSLLAGWRLYLVTFVTGLSMRLGWIDLPDKLAALDVLANPWVLVIAVFQQLFGGAGLLSQILRDHGYDGLSLMTDPETFKFLITAQSVWKDAGWGIIVFLAALASVSPDLYEAAAMDGANRWRRMWHVTLPALRPVIALLLVLRVGDALTVGFEQILLQRDAVGPGASEVLDTFVWWNGVRNQDFGYAAAAGLVKGVISLGLVLVANKVAHLMGEQGVYKK